MDTFYSTMESPIGPLTIAGNDDFITHMLMQNQKHYTEMEDGWQRDDSRFQVAREQLTSYFASELQRFDLPLDPHGTPFQTTVWKALLDIPFGKTESYGELAKRIGSPKASRAVGMANGRNPISIIIPCHRVIGANGSLTGYGGGMERKQWLLAHEQTDELQLEFAD